MSRGRTCLFATRLRPKVRAEFGTYCIDWIFWSKHECGGGRRNGPGRDAGTYSGRRHRAPMPLGVSAPVTERPAQRLMENESEQVRRTRLGQRIRDGALLVAKSLVLVAVTTIGLLILDQFFTLRHVTLVYLVPVVIAATKLGIWPAVIAAMAGGRRISILLLPADIQLSCARSATSDRAPALRLRRDRDRSSGDQSQATGRSGAPP